MLYSERNQPKEATTIALDLSKWFIKPKKKVNSEWSELVEVILERLKKDWDSDRFKPLTWGRLCGKLSQSGIRKENIRELYILHKEAEKAKNYSKYFWWKLKELKK